MSKVTKAKNSVKTAYNEANNLLRNIERFIQSCCLLIVSYGSYHYATNYELRNEYKWTLLFSSVLIGLHGAVLLINHINKK